MIIGSMNSPKKDILLEIERIAQQGFDYIDLTYEWPFEKEINKNKIKKKLQDLNLGVIGHTNPTLPAVYPEKRIREVCWQELREAFDFFHFIDCKKISIHPFYYYAYMDEERLFSGNIELFRKSVEYCSGLGIQLMVENCFSPFGSAEEVERIFRAVPHLKIHLDIGHINLLNDFGDEFKKFLKKFDKQIIHCHIHDNSGDKDDHLPLGCGTIGWKEVVISLKKINYDQSFTLEVFCSDDDFIILSKNKWKRLWSQE